MLESTFLDDECDRFFLFRSVLAFLTQLDTSHVQLQLLTPELHSYHLYLVLHLSHLVSHLFIRIFNLTILIFKVVTLLGLLNFRIKNWNVSESLGWNRINTILTLHLEISKSCFSLKQTQAKLYSFQNFWIAQIWKVLLFVKKYKRTDKFYYI